MKLWFLSLTFLVALFSSLPVAAQVIGEPPPPGGISYDMPDGTRVVLQLREANFSLFFLDAEGLIAEPTYAEAAVRWEDFRNRNDDGYILLKQSGDLPYLTNPRRPSAAPIYRVRLLIIHPDGGDNNIAFSWERLRPS